MKYRVSMLPEEYRKRLNGKKKLEKIKVYSLVVLLVLAVFTFVVMFTSLIANKQLDRVKRLNVECAQEVAELEQFREINANLQQKVQLIESIQVEEPQLVNFVASISNINCPGITITSLECTDWKTTRNCVLTGECDNREQYLAFEEALRGVEGISLVTPSTYVPGVGEETKVQFSVNIVCTGGAAVVTTQAATEATTAADAEATDVAVE